MGLFVTMSGIANTERNKDYRAAGTIGGRKDYLVVGTIACMITGLFFSRALLTCSGFLFFLLSFVGNGFESMKRNYFNKYNVLLLLLFLIPLVSGFWSSNTVEWWQRTEIKLPFLLLPAACSLLVLRREHYIGLSFLFIAFVLTGTVSSFIEYIQAPSSVHAGYLTSTLMPVWLNNDHVLFSWAIVIAIILIFILYPMVKQNLGFATALWVMVSWLVIFLHLLAARTGLISLYVVAITWGIYKLKKRSIKQGVLLLVVVISLPVLAYFLLPTFHNRALYVLYDLQQYSRGNYQPGFSDVSRIISYKGGLDITKHHWLTGVGFGDVADSMQNWYSIKFSYLPSQNRLLPHNEGLIYYSGSGIFALIIFCYIVFFPLFVKAKWPWIAFHLTAITGFLTDATLETQNGVFLYCFFICWLKIGCDQRLLSSNIEL